MTFPFKMVPFSGTFVHFRRGVTFSKMLVDETRILDSTLTALVRGLEQKRGGHFGSSGCH